MKYIHYESLAQIFYYTTFASKKIFILQKFLHILPHFLIGCFPWYACHTLPDYASQYVSMRPSPQNLSWQNHGLYRYLPCLLRPRECLKNI